MGGRAVPDSLRGVTTSMSLQFLTPARATDLIAIGRVLRRGKTLANRDVDVVTPDGEAVAKAIATYKGTASQSFGVMTARPCNLAVVQ